ncbi:hypothetical protein VTK73DRAFT_3893 [Phialemonium thermophilum]|uniref:Uncharacterized protein n=1 Tax=Phialemonium thermophilum TaxID=223376 RepID=A0ABR3VDF1_9PEZI
MVSLTSLLGAVSAAAVVVQALPPVFRVVRTSDEAALDRRQSSDPACPAGFVCSGGPCPSDVACEAGETCVNFGGTIGCVPSGSKVCAVQPTSLEAVICLAENGVCCHGSCYAAGAVCCDFPGVQCSFGVPCPDVCPSGQTCGSTACVGGGASSSSSTTTTTTSTTTSKPPTLPPPSTSMPPTAEPTSTVSPPSAPSSTAPPSTTTSSTTIAPPTTPSTTTTTSSTPASASSSTAPSPSGPSVGSFRLDGCFLDDPVIRALQNGSSTSSDMTVEKCVSLADGWRYAGLEHGT